MILHYIPLVKKIFYYLKNLASLLLGLQPIMKDKDTQKGRYQRLLVKH